MKICNCTLLYTNPNACKHCGANQEYDYSQTDIPFIYKNIPKKRITKEYDDKGKLIKEVIEDL